MKELDLKRFEPKDKIITIKNLDGEDRKFRIKRAPATEGMELATYGIQLLLKPEMHQLLKDLVMPIVAHSSFIDEDGDEHPLINDKVIDAVCGDAATFQKLIKEIADFNLNFLKGVPHFLDQVGFTPELRSGLTHFLRLFSKPLSTKE